MPNPSTINNYGSGATRTKRRASGCLLVLSILMFTLAIFLPAYLEQRVHDGLSERLYYTRDRQNTDTMRWWIDGSSPGAPGQYVTYRIAFIRNPEDYMNGSRPVLGESGAYTFRKIVRRFDLVWGNDTMGRNTLSYFERVNYYFDPSRSTPGVTVNDTYRVVNVVFLGLVAQTLPLGLGGVLTGLYPDENYTDATRLFTVRQVHEILFGYNDTHVGAAHPGVLKNQTDEDARREGRCAIFVGDDDPSRVREMFMWQGSEDIMTSATMISEKTLTWGQPFANRVFGTDGQVFRRNLQKGDSVSSFNYDVARTVTLQHTGETYAVRGINLFKFMLHPRTFLNASRHAENAAYYQFGPEGFFNITRPRSGVPVFVSMPYFYGVDPRVRNNFDGLPPNPDLTLYIGVEPRSGLTMHAHKRNQVNFLVTQLNFTVGLFPPVPVRWLQNVRPHTYIPFVWGDEAGVISDSQASLFKNSLQVALTAADVLKYGGFIIGLLSLIVCVALYVTTPTQPKETLLSQPTDD